MSGFHRVSPLRPQHESFVKSALESEHGEGAYRPGAAVGARVASDGRGVEYIPYGPGGEPADAVAPLSERVLRSESGATESGATCELVASYGEVELEYAAIRRGAGLFDSPQRGTLLITGRDRREFLNRMVTQELRDLAPGQARAGFWLNRKGRIDADLLIIELGERMLIDVDIHQAAHTVATLSAFVFAEDVEIRDVSDEHHHVALHGPSALEVVAAGAGTGAGARGGSELDAGGARIITIVGVEVVIARRDQTGEIGIEIIMPYAEAPRVWDALASGNAALNEGSRQQGAGSSEGAKSSTAHCPLPTASSERRRVRPVGWHAFNIARIEAGTPLFNIDFGPTNLPHETGILRERVSFTKGCYLGQEIVARMESLGRPKQTLVGLRMQADLLPVAGAQVFAKAESGGMGEQIGVVTSSTMSPMLGAVPIAFAMLKTVHAAEGATVLVNAEGEQGEAVVQPLRFWQRGESSSA